MPPKKSKKRDLEETEQNEDGGSVVDKYNSMKNPELKELLKLNGMKSSGNKAELAAWCTEGETLGVPPMCPLCKRARTRSTPEGTFKCPGYFDSVEKAVQKCEFDGPGEREPWFNSLKEKEAAAKKKSGSEF